MQRRQRFCSIEFFFLSGPFTGHDSIHGPNHQLFDSPVEFGRVRRYSKRIESGRIGSGRVGSRVGSGRVGSGRVKRISKSHESSRVGSCEL